MVQRLPPSWRSSAMVLIIIRCSLRRDDTLPSVRLSTEDKHEDHDFAQLGSTTTLSHTKLCAGYR